MQSIGFICDVRANSNPSPVAGASRLQRAVPMAGILRESGLDLFAYARRHVNPRTGMAFGYCIRDKRFVPDTRPVPRVNGYWAFGNVPSPDINGLSHLRFVEWGRDNGIEVYPPYEFLKLTLDKCATYDLVSAFDPRLHPYTERFRRSDEQLTQFLETGPATFIKPRFGSQGEGVIVLRRTRSGFSLTVYRGGKVTSDTVRSPRDLLAKVSSLADDGRYVIQRGVNVMRHENATFIIRAIMVSDGREWRCTPKLVMTPGSGDVANTSQGGRNFTLEEQLPVIYGSRVAERSAEELRATSLALAAHLDTLYAQQLMEVAFDFMLDEDGAVFLGEMDVQPGLVRPGMNPHEPFKDIFDIQPDERAVYDEYVVPHAECLARFLQSKLTDAPAVNGGGVEPARASVIVPSTPTIGHAIDDGPQHVGFLCNVNTAGNPVSTLRPSVLDRSIMIDERLRDAGLRLFLYSPKHARCDAYEIPGYVIEDREFVAATAPMPQVNANFTAVSRQLLRKGMGYRTFLAWTRRNGIEIYAPYAFSDLVRNKHRTYGIVSQFSPELHPYTEPCDHSAAQLEEFVQRGELVFLKPTGGNKGDGIMVLRRAGDGFALTHHAAGEQRCADTATVGEAAALAREFAGKQRYVIQQGVETLRLDGAAFDVRVIMVNDGSRWHWIHETRVGAQGSALSNIHQGGASMETEQALARALTPGDRDRVMQELHGVSHGLADFLDSLYAGGLMEMAFDFMLDHEHRIHLAEINTKPGLAGIGHASTILDGNPDEAANYERYVVPHVIWLAGFLQTRFERVRHALIP